jgi:hypothetical protein
MARTGESRQAPMCLALILSEGIYRDSISGKRTLFGMFSTLFAPEFPATHSFMAVYCVLTDGYGSTSITLKIEGPDGSETIPEMNGIVEFTDPRLVVELDFILQNVVFPTPGEYRIQVYGAGEFLLERRLMVAEIPGGQKHADNN